MKKRLLWVTSIALMALIAAFMLGCDDPEPQTVEYNITVGEFGEIPAGYRVDISRQSAAAGFSVRVSLAGGTAYRFVAGSVTYKAADGSGAPVVIVLANTRQGNFTMPAFNIIVSGAIEVSTGGGIENPPIGDIKPPWLSEVPDLTKWDAELKAIIANMSLEEKVGQTMQPDRRGLSNTGTQDLQEIKRYHLGSVLSGGGSFPNIGTGTGGISSHPNTPQGWVNMIDTFMTFSMEMGQLLPNSSAPAGLRGIPILYGIDAVHGNSNRACDLLPP